MGHDRWAPTQSAEGVGSMARHVLAAEPRGTILAGHSRATYLLSAGGELLWLASEDVPMHRRGIRVSGPMPRPAPGSAYRFAGDRLRLGSAAVIDLGQALVWEPEHRAWQPHLVEAGPRRRLGTASGLLVDLPPPRGFGTFLPTLTEYAHGGALPGRAPLQTPVLASASPWVFAIARACRERDGAALLRLAEGLVGLGEGLTPSGDDYLGGVLFSLSVLRSAGIGVPGWSPDAVASFLESSRRRTNRVSFALLSDHAAGHACEPLHRFVVALLANEPPESTVRAASDLIRVGSSTGWDTLTGAWTGSVLAPMMATMSRLRVGTEAVAAAP
jgi:hypothetical protein